MRGLKVNKEKKTKGFFSSSGTGVLTDLVPFSQYKMYMVVANSRYEGPPSNTAEFKTKEGGMELKVESLCVCVLVFISTHRYSVGVSNHN